MSENNQSLVVTINEEIKRELTAPGVARALLSTTFKGLDEVKMKQAIMEGMIRGFTFKDFLQKNVYAIPFAGAYSLVTSIDNSRKIGAKSGIIGKDKPIFTEENGKIKSCAVTVKKIIQGHVGEFTAEVYFSEYYKAGKNGYPSLWDTKPRTMLAKVAEMHALRMACPEELSQQYIEEEMSDVAVVRVDDERFAKANKEADSLKMKNLEKTNKNEKDKEIEPEEDQSEELADSDPDIEA